MGQENPQTKRLHQLTTVYAFLNAQVKNYFLLVHLKMHILWSIDSQEN